MAFPEVTFRQLLDAGTLQELDQYSALLQGYLSQEHDDEGAHTHITAESAAIEGAMSAGSGAFTNSVTIGDNLTVADALTHNGLLTQNSTRNVSVTAPTQAWNNGGELSFEMNLRVTSVFGTTSTLDGAAVPSTANGIGTVYRVFNASGAAFKVNHESSLASSATYRFLCPNSANLTIPSNGAFEMLYDATSERWRVLSSSTPYATWSSYEPTWTNVTVGNGVVRARKMTVNGATFFDIYFTLGSTSSITGTVIVSTPTTAANVASGVSVGTCVYRDDSASARYTGAALITTGTTITLVDGAQPNAVVTATVPFTFAENDTIHIRGNYQEA